MTKTPTMPASWARLAPHAPSRAIGAPTRILVVSDLCDTGRTIRHPDPSSFDMVVAAGDVTGSAVDTMTGLRDAFPAPVPIVAVLGDREYRGTDRAMTSFRDDDAARTCGVDLIQDGQTVVDGIRFVGGTLWTDYRLHGTDLPMVEAAFNAAQPQFDDLRITLANGHAMDPYSATWAHFLSLKSMVPILDEHFSGPTVVVTHHAPSALSLPPGMRDHPLAPSMASPRDGFVATCGAALWIHGHVPEPADHHIGGTRVVANPGGAGHGCHGLIVEVARGNA